MTITSNLTYNEIQTKVGHMLGYGRTVGSYSSSQVTDIDECIKDGVRQVLRAHEWAFLRPVTTFTLYADVAATAITATTTGTALVADAAATPFHGDMVGATITLATAGDVVVKTVTDATNIVLVTAPAVDASAETFTISWNGNFRLPADFAEVVDGYMTYHVTSVSTIRVDEVGEGQIRRLRQQDVGANKPRIFAVRPIAPDLTDATGQRFELLSYPEPDEDYVFSFRYAIMLNDVDDTTNIYPPGGQWMSDVYLKSCLSVADKVHNDTFGGGREADYRDALRFAIEADEKRDAPVSLGLNVDQSDSRRGILSPGDYRKVYSNHLVLHENDGRS